MKMRNRMPCMKCGGMKKMAPGGMFGDDPCPPGKQINPATGECECPPGKRESAFTGECIDNPFDPRLPKNQQTYGFQNFSQYDCPTGYKYDIVTRKCQPLSYFDKLREENNNRFKKFPTFEELLKSSNDLFFNGKPKEFSLLDKTKFPFVNPDGSPACGDLYKWDFITKKCIVNTDVAIQLPNGQVIPKRIGGCKEGETIDLLTGECVPRKESTDTTTTLPPDKYQIPANVILEGANTAVNLISKMFNTRDQNRYMEDQIRQMSFREPMPYWATNEQKGVPGYNLYFEQGGLINNNNKNKNMIKIKEENRGKFTAQAKRAGMGTQEFASYVLGNPDEFSASTAKRANFAKNAAGWKKEYGGMTMNNPYYGYYQDGGPVPMEGAPMQAGAPGGGQEDQLQQIIQMIIEALQEGMSPDQILQALVQMGIPQEQAAQLLQMVMEKMQEAGGGQGQMEGEGQMMQQAAPPMRRGGYYQDGGMTEQEAMSQDQGQMGNTRDMMNTMNTNMNAIIKAYSQMKGIPERDLLRQLSQLDDTAKENKLRTWLSEIQITEQSMQQGQDQGMMRAGGMISNYR